MAHQVGRVPPQAVEHSGDVGHGLGDRELALLRGRSETALLVGHNLVASSELRHSIVDIFEAHSRTAVDRQHSRSSATDPTRELTGPRVNREGSSFHDGSLGLLRGSIALPSGDARPSPVLLARMRLSPEWGTGASVAVPPVGAVEIQSALASSKADRGGIRWSTCARRCRFCARETRRQPAERHPESCR